MDVEENIKKYRSIQPVYQNYVIELSDLLITLLKQAGIAYHVVERRAKTVESFADKISSPGKKYKNPIAEITDLAGIRIVLLYLNDIDQVINLIRKNFDIDEANSVNKVEIIPPDQFGYQSVHLIVTLDKKRSLLPEWSSFAGLKAEIQVRTVLQHAWAAISHKLQYKNKTEIPRQLKRRLYRLSGLLELADEEFLGLRNQQEELRGKIATAIDKHDLEVEINRLSLREYLESSQTVKKLINIAEKSGVDIMSIEQEDAWTSELMKVLSCLEINRIEELNKFLQGSLHWEKAVFDKLHQEKEEDEGRPKMSVPFLIGLIFIVYYCKKLPSNIQSKVGVYQRKLSSLNKIISNK